MNRLLQCRHLSIASDSVAELETHLMIAQRLNYIDQNILNPLLENAPEVGRMLNGLRNALQDKLTPSP